MSCLHLDDLGIVQLITIINVCLKILHCIAAEVIVLGTLKLITGIPFSTFLTVIKKNNWRETNFDAPYRNEKTAKKKQAGVRRIFFL